MVGARTPRVITTPTQARCAGADAQPTDQPSPMTGNQQMVFCFAAATPAPARAPSVRPAPPRTSSSSERRKMFIRTRPPTAATVRRAVTAVPRSTPEANSAADIASFSSRGPVADSYRSPTSSRRARTSPAVWARACDDERHTGAAISCLKARAFAACPAAARSAANNFFPLGQQFYSHVVRHEPLDAWSCGRVRLLRQYFINASLAPPSPAMTRRSSSTPPLHDGHESAGDNLPSPDQGMGAVNLGTRLMASRVCYATGERGQVHRFGPDTLHQRHCGGFRQTLPRHACTDRCARQHHRECLQQQSRSHRHRGRHRLQRKRLHWRHLQPGGTADAKNNLESVFIPPASPAVRRHRHCGEHRLRQRPQRSPTLDQDYALVIYNATETPTPVISTDGYALTAENCLSTNGVVDANEP